MATPLMTLPREIRDRILSYLLSSELEQEHDKHYLGLLSASGARYIMKNRELLEHPIRRVNYQLYEESTQVIRDLLTHAEFHLGYGLADGYMAYLILRAMSPALCSLLRAVELGDQTFDNSGNGEVNHALWDGSASEGHLGEMMVAKLVYLRYVRIRAPGIEGHGPEDEDTAEQYNTMDLCTRFFAAQLRDGRIDSLKLLVERDKTNLASGAEVTIDDPAHGYVAALEEPWCSLDQSMRVEDVESVNLAATDDPRERSFAMWTEPKKKWTISFKSKATDHHSPSEARI